MDGSNYVHYRKVSDLHLTIRFYKTRMQANLSGSSIIDLNQKFEIFYYKPIYLIMNVML